MANSANWCFEETAVQFLTDLKANNNKEWFVANKPVYERDVKAAALEYSTFICQELQSLTQQTHTAKVFRVYRDVRFSKDKTPYNAHLHISFMPDEGKGASPAWFFALEPEKLIFGAGAFGLTTPLLERFRERIAADEGKELQALLAELTAGGIRLSEPELKRVPRGYDPDQDYSPLLRHKSLTAWRDIAGTGAATRAGLINRSMEEFLSLKPLVDWLSRI